MNMNSVITFTLLLATIDLEKDSDKDSMYLLLESVLKKGIFASFFLACSFINDN